MKSNISTLFGIIAVVVVLIVSSLLLGGYGALATSLLIAVGLADHSTQPNNPTERVND